MRYHLLVKINNKTGLKYLCRHFGTTESCFVYPGSGIYWKNHIRKHGKDISTNILLETDSLEELREKGLYYSDLWDVVKSKEWANLCPEMGKGGLTRVGFKHSPETKEKLRLARLGKKYSLETKEKISKALKGKIFTLEHRNNIRLAHLGKKHTPESIEKMRLIKIGKKMGKDNPMYGKHLSIEAREKISKIHKGTKKSEETKAKMRIAAKAREDLKRSRKLCFL